MHFHKLFLLFGLTLLLDACGDGKDLNSNFRIQTDAKKNTIQNGESVSISLKAKRDLVIDSVTYYLDGQYLSSKTDISPITAQIDLAQLGTKSLKAKIYAADNVGETTEELIVVSNTRPKLLKYEIVNRYPHDTSSYTQGLEFENGELYESAGQYGESSLRKVELKTGKVIKKIPIDKQYFAEGLTIINGKIIQLTWRSKTGFVYDLNTMNRQTTFTYNQSKEGWGLCNDGNIIYKSDGTAKIWKLDPENLSEQGYIEIVDNKTLRSKYNELEWVNGKIYANTYQNDGISVINPETGAIEAVIDLRSLKKEVQNGLDSQNEVLNGIAYDEQTGKLYVTGKHWNTLFEIKILE